MNFAASGLNSVAQLSINSNTRSIALVVGVIAVSLLIGGAVWMADRKRRQGIERALTAAGFDVDFKPAAMDKQAFFASMSLALDHLKTGSSGVKWVATRRSRSGSDQPPQMWIFEHSYTVGGGKNRRTITNAVAALPCAAAWPKCAVLEEHLGDKIMGMLGKKGLDLEDAAFNKRWKIQAASEDFAVLLLNPEVQRWLMDLPKKSWLRIGGGMLCVGITGQLNAEKVVLLAGCPESVVALIPPELGAWGAR